MLKEFNDFIKKGNVIDLAIAVIMAGAFGEIVGKLVDGILMPIIGAITAGIDFAAIKLNVLGVDLLVGEFLNSVIKFVIIAFVMFLIVKAFNKMKKEEVAEVTTKECPHCKSEVHKDATRCPHCTSEL